MSGPLRQMLNLARPYWREMMLAWLLSLLTIGSGVGLLMTSAWLISAAALHPSIADLQVAIVGVRFFGLSRGVFRYLERLISHSATFRILSELRVRVFRALIPGAPLNLVGLKSGDLLTRFMSDVDRLQHLYIRLIAPPLTATGTLIIMSLAMTFLVHPAPALILMAGLLAAMVPAPLLIHLCARNTNSHQSRLHTQLRQQVLDLVQGLPDLRAFGHEATFTTQLQETGELYTAATEKLERIEGGGEALTGLMRDLTAIAVLAAAVAAYSRSEMDGRLIAVAVLGTLASFEATFPLSSAMRHLRAISASAARIVTITGPLTPNIPPSNLTPKYSNSQKPLEVNIEHLNFAYPDQPPVFEHFSLHLAPGSKTVLLGPSGCGKTTLLNLLQRYLPPTSVEVHLNNRNLSSIPQEELFCLLGCVPQRAHLFHGTIRENLLLAKEDATDSELEEALRQAQIWNFVQSLPLKLETQVGERGANVSGGELRRLTLARTLLRKPGLILLDEPCSGLDAETAQAFMETLTQLSYNPTLLISSHRPEGLNLQGIRVVDLISHL